MAFDFKKNLIKVQGRQYLPVSARIVWFREVHPDWAIVTEPLEINHEKQYAVFRATVFNADGKIMATGTKKEDVKGFGDYLEKAETGSVGRALALCGFGTQFSPELDEVGGGRLADSPQPMGGRYGGGGGYGNGGGGGYRGESRSGYGGSRETTAPNMPEPPRRFENRPMSATPLTHPNLETDDDFDAPEDSAGLLSAATDDPFDDVSATPAKPTAMKMESAPGAALACTDCGKSLTKAQQELSIRNYGAALCPNCQRDKTRNGRAAVAEH